MLQSHAGSRSVARTHGAVAHLPHLAQAPAASAHLTAALGDVSCYHHCQAAHTKHVCLRQRATVRCAASSADASPATSAVPSTQWIQRVIELPSFPRGCHIVTSRIRDAVPEIAEYEMGLANLFIQHTSASLTINENASPDVALDLNDAMDRIVPEGRHYRHDDEGSDDMPAHVKSSLLGASLTVPIAHGRMALGTWQGIYLNEHRNYGGPRRVVITVQGQKRADGRRYGQHQL